MLLKFAIDWDFMLSLLVDCVWPLLDLERLASLYLRDSYYVIISFLIILVDLILSS